MTDVRMFTQDEVEIMLIEAGAADDYEGARAWLDRWHEQRRDADRRGFAGELRAHGASAVEGTTLMDVDEGQQILVPTHVADGIYAVADHFGVTVRSLVTELQTEVRRRRAAAQRPE